MRHNYAHTLYRIACWLTVLFPLAMLAGHVATDIALSVVAVLFLAHCAIEKNWQWCTQPWVKWVTLLWLYMIVRSAFADSPVDALRRSLPFARYFVFAAALSCWTLQDADNRRRFIAVLTGVTVFCACDGLAQWLIGREIFLHTTIPTTEGYMRLTGPFGKEILGIMLAWLSFPVCLALIMTPQGALTRGRRLFVGVAAILLIFAVIVLSGERMALMLTLLGWLLALLLLPLKRHITFIVFSGGILLIGLLAFLNPQVSERQIHSTLATLQNWQQSPYGLLFASDMKLAEIQPVFGIGTNLFRVACKTLYPALPANTLTNVCNTHPHNIYMEFLIENGVIGFILFVAFLAAALRQCFRAWPKLRIDPVFIGLLIAFLLRIWPIASTTSFFSPWGAPPFWLVLGALLAYTAGSGEKNDAHPSFAL